MKNIKEVNLRIAILQGTYNSMTCVSIVYFVQAFQRFGIDKLTIGIIMMLSNIVAAVMQPFWGYLCDKIGNPRKIIISCCIVGGILYFGLIYSGGNIIIITLAAMGVFATYHPMMHLLDSWVTKLIVEGYKINYGATRSGGSVSYALTAAIFGVAVTRFGMFIAPYVFTGLCLIFCIVAIKVPNPITHVQNKGKISPSSSISYLVKNNAYIIFMVAYFLTTLTHSSNNTFYSVLVFEMGGNETHVGIGLFISAIVEIPGLVFYNSFRKKTGMKTNNVLATAMFFYFLKCLMMALSPNIGFIMIANTLQAVSFAIFMPAMIEYLIENVDKTFLSTAQMFLIAIGVSMGSILSNPISGALAENIGTKTMLKIMSLFSLFGMVLMILSPVIIRKSTQHKDNRQLYI
ncbi:MAG TPA: MFS transporter [Clostridiaceae bacterium]|nr:MFS transporter [Clostridiaceae bacterium]